MSSPLADQLERARNELLDLTARNRLLNTPLARGRSTRLDIVDELSTEVFRITVQERRDMGFLPTNKPDANELDDGKEIAADQLDMEESEDADEELHISQPEDIGEGPQDRHSDRNLQTVLNDEKLQTRLLRLFYDSKTMFEEQGVNSLFLAMGFLEWYESPTSDKVRFAPLLLIPVELHRRTVNARFRLRGLDEEITTNLSLQAKLKVDFGLRLPDVPDVDDLIPSDYFSAVEPAITDKPRWKVHRDRMTLWHFSFAKFLMFRDLDTEVWPEGKGPSDHPLMCGLLGEPVVFEPPLIAENEPLDTRLNPQMLCHVVDCDSSQAAAIEEVRGGRNLVVQGPPGTGKSQSIANVIASAVRDGKSVLFVAEKLAALQVVKSRLDRIGLGDICLELHSHKANRRSVLDDLGRTLDLGRPANKNVEQQAAELARTRERLNKYSIQLHSPIPSFGRTPYEIIGKLCRLQAKGITPLGCDVPDIAAWSMTTLGEKQALLRDIVQHLAETGVPKDHLWNGVRRLRPLLPSDLASLQSQLEKLCQNSRQILEHATRLASLLNLAWNPDQESFQAVQSLAQFIAKLRDIPEMDRTAFADPLWEQQREKISRVIERGKELAQCQESLAGIMAPVAWQTDVSQVRNDLAATGRSLFRWFNGRWRRAIGRLRGICLQSVPKSLDDQLRLLDMLMTGQSCLEDLNGIGGPASVGKVAFGSLWQGAESDWNRLTVITNWEADCRGSGIPKSFRRVIAKWKDSEGTQAAYVALKSIFKETWDGIRGLLKELEVDANRTFGQNSLIEIPLAMILSQLSGWRNKTSELGRWIVFQRRLRELDQAGLGSLIPQIEQGNLDGRSLDSLELMFCEAAMRQVLTEREDIAGFDGITHSRLVEEFRELDRERIRLTRHEVAAVHFNRLPTGGDMGEVGTIRGEIRKKRKHMPLRKLLAKAGHAVQAIKPVFMMSPISIAQFLEPGVLSFDLLVIDEASQVRPVEALGAVLRCRQAVVVGDNRQLPPTAFFDRVIAGDDQPDDQDGTAAADVESILDLCLARNFPQRMLRWHYRSRHHSLIAVSNREFYDNGLFVIPSPERGGSGKGLEFQFIQDGIFDRGQSRTNRREAKAVAMAMIEHAQRFSELSLGVGTFSVAQRDAILDELELLRRAHPETEEFFSRSDAEPWFVKNLENIQGDERDTIFISVGYGRDANGNPPAMQFGPLTAKGGERRLNVLISRSKQRCVVFSSMRSDDIDLRRTNARGAEALKTFLHYAETGRMEINRLTDREYDSEFEAQVADALRDSGWQTDPQVGIAGFFIDLAVVDPATPGRYLLGIECDGATYHSARWARDRDRLRQEVLEGHGWMIHRIWSTDWFHSRDEQLRKLLAKLDDLRTQGKRDHEAQIESEDSTESVTVEFAALPVDGDDEISRVETENNSELLEFATPYRETQITDVQVAHQMISREIHQLAPTELAQVVAAIVQVEGPIHSDEIARRTTSLWGLQRAGNRIGNAVIRALNFAVDRGHLVESASFYTRSGQQELSVRNRENVASANLRKPEMLPPQEIDAAIMAFIQAHISATPDETSRAVARLLGFRSTSQQLRSRIDSRIEFLLTANRLCNDRDVLRDAQSENAQ